MSHLDIRIKKNPDGTIALTCTRADGTSTWQRQDVGRATHFVFHDLTHYAVETVLGSRRAFYGLLAAGWDLGDFGGGWPRGRLPEEAGRVEVLVGLLDMERADGVPRKAEEFAQQAALHYASQGVAGEPPRLTEAQLGKIRERRRELFARWAAVSPGEAMELAFDPDSAC